MCSAGLTGLALGADELAAGGLGQADALQVEGTAALALTQQQLSGLLANLPRNSHNIHVKLGRNRVFI